jgi:uncharacterized protein with FMN-binding domain
MRNGLNTEPALRSPDSLPKRASLALPPRPAVATFIATVLGLVLLFSFKTPDEPPASNRPVAVAPGTPVPRATSPSASRATSPASPTARASSSPASSPPSPNGGSQQFDGSVIATRFGDVQVRLVESSGKITDVQALQLPSDRRRSLEISQFVQPILHDEALQAQSAQIDTVSGATYTSEAYSTSLQSALDRAHG